VNNWLKASLVYNNTKAVRTFAKSVYDKIITIERKKKQNIKKYNNKKKKTTNPSPPKKKNYHIVRSVPKFNRKLIETEAKSI